MDETEGRKTAVLALGNSLFSDDGTGPAALRLLEGAAGLPDGAVFIDGSALGLEAAAMIAGTDRLLILDSVNADAAPGTVIRMEGDALTGLRGGGSVHRLGLGDLVSALAVMGRMPKDVVLLGIQPASVEMGVELTPAVSSALPGLVSACLRQLREWG
jgi:hydrogenase maturation protease